MTQVQVQQQEQVQDDDIGTPAHTVDHVHSGADVPFVPPRPTAPPRLSLDRAAYRDHRPSRSGGSRNRVSVDGGSSSTAISFSELGVDYHGGRWGSSSLPREPVATNEQHVRVHINQPNLIEGGVYRSQLPLPNTIGGVGGDAGDQGDNGQDDNGGDNDEDEDVGGDDDDGGDNDGDEDAGGDDDDGGDNDGDEDAGGDDDDGGDNNGDKDAGGDDDDGGDNDEDEGDGEGEHHGRHGEGPSDGIHRRSKEKGGIFSSLRSVVKKAERFTPSLIKKKKK